MTAMLRSAALAAAVMMSAATAQAQTPRANGEALVIQNYAGTTGNMHAVIAQKKGFCEKYNFKCELRTMRTGPEGLKALSDRTIDIAQIGPDLVAESGDKNLVLLGLSVAPVVLS